MIRRRLSRFGFTALLAVFVASAGAAQLVADKGVAWASLTAAQQQVLAPLQRDWPNIEPNRRLKWLEVSRRFNSMAPDERKRVQERMAEWARLTPAERTQARLQFQEVRQLPAEERHAKWQAYQALPESERRTLAQRALPAAKSASGGASAMASGSRPRPLTKDDGAARHASSGAASSSASRLTTPIVVQARPGATTTTMTTRAGAQTARAGTQGAPKIAATSSYVDPATLLPKRNASDSRTAPPGGSSPQQ